MFLHKWPTIFNFLVSRTVFFRAEFISAQMTCHFLFSGDRTYFFLEQNFVSAQMACPFFFFKKWPGYFFLPTWPVIFCAIFNIPDLLCIINKIIESKG